MLMATGAETYNKGFCNKCKKLVPADHCFRDGKVYLVKDCPDCGLTETLIAADAERYQIKRSLDGDYPYHVCNLTCDSCDHGRLPCFVFVNVTNRCNLNCPICIDNVPGLGFTFEPPMEYFEKLFARLADCDPSPTVALFGGEPTVRDDLFDIIELARSYDLGVRCLTNGLRLADMDFCRRLVESRARILMSYDGCNPKTYKHLRGRESALDRKLQAIENLGQLDMVKRHKVILIMCMAKGLNAEEVGDYLQFCHDHRDIVTGVHLMPLAHTWDFSDSEFQPERITMEDIEQLVDDLYPDARVDFLPAGFVAGLAKAAGYAGMRKLPFPGAHPNCESIYLLVSDGERYHPLSRFLRRPLPEAGRAVQELQKRIAEREKTWKRTLPGRMLHGLRLGKPLLKFIGAMQILNFVRREVRLGELFKGSGLTRFWHALALLTAIALGRSRSAAMARHTNVENCLQVVILPFEDDEVLETERIQRCPNAHAYLDPETDELRFVPICAWRVHNQRVLKQLADSFAEKVAV